MKLSITTGFVFCAALAVRVAETRTINIVNNCSYTVWPGVNPAGAGEPGGFQLNPGGSDVYTVPANWAGRIWGRRSCTTNSAGNFVCLDGACGTQEDCSSPGGPASLAQFGFVPNVPDTYSLSLVDGANIPMRIENNQGCPAPVCSYDLTSTCPSNRATTNAAGQTVFCASCNGPTAPPGCNATYFPTSCPNANSVPSSSSGSGQCVNTAQYTVRFCPT